MEKSVLFSYKTRKLPWS